MRKEPGKISHFRGGTLDEESESPIGNNVQAGIRNAVPVESLDNFEPRATIRADVLPCADPDAMFY